MITFPECTDNTSLKHNHFESFLSLHITLWKVIVRKNKWALPTYTYIDLNSGPGVYPNGLECSPLRFLRLARKYHIDYNATCIDNVETNVTSTIGYSANYPYLFGSVSFKHGDNLEEVRKLCSQKVMNKDVMGLVFADPLGAGKKEFECLELLARNFRYLDLLIHLQGASIKRCNKAIDESKGFDTLEGWINRIGKKKVLIRTPYGKHQFSFAFFTNWVKAPEYKRIEFYDIDSQKGSEIFRQLNYTKTEAQHGFSSCKDR